MTTNSNPRQYQRLNMCGMFYISTALYPEKLVHMLVYRMTPYVHTLLLWTQHRIKLKIVLHDLNHSLPICSHSVLCAVLMCESCVIMMHVGIVSCECPWIHQEMSVNTVLCLCRPRLTSVVFKYIYICYLQLSWHPVAVLQYTFTNKQNSTINLGRVWAVPRLCELYAGLCLTTEEKARKNISQFRKNFIQGRKTLVRLKS